VLFNLKTLAEVAEEREVRVGVLRSRPKCRGVCPAYGTTPQPVSALLTPLTSCAIGTVPSAFANAGHALAGRVPRAILTPRISSLIDTDPFSLQSPVQGAGVALGVFVADRIGVGVSADVALEVALGAVVGDEMVVPVAVRIAVAVVIADGVAVVVGISVDVALGVGVGVEDLGDV